MKRSKFTDGQITVASHQTAEGVTVREICRKLGMSEQTYYRWRKQYGGLVPAEIKRLRQLEEENQRHKK